MKAGLQLRFERTGARTQLHTGVQDPPWRVIRAFAHPDGAGQVHLHNVSGGILAGDSLSLEIQVGRGARAQVTSTGATRLYRHSPGKPDSEQSISISVAEGGLLEYLPDAIIPFTGARHRQQTDILLGDGAAYFGWEVVAPGRQAMGEQFRFEHLTLRTRVDSETRPLFYEDLVLEPWRQHYRAPSQLGPYSHTAVFLALQPGRSAGGWLELEANLNEAASRESQPGCAIWGASALAADGVIVRGLSTTARRLPATLAVFWAIARRFLTGEQAVPPRKLS